MFPAISLSCRRLEFEKCYLPLLLFKKKRYAGLMFTKEDAPDKIDSKGIQLVRRDVIPYVRDVSKRVLDAIMYEKSVVKARMLARDCARDLLEGRVPTEALILSKSLQKTYKNDQLPHVAVARRLEERDPGSGPKPGDRVPYVFVKVPDPNAKQTVRAECPAHAVAHGLPIDHAYYLEHSYVTPILALLELVIPGKDTRDKQAKLFGDFLRRSKNIARSQPEITSFFTKRS